MSAELKRLRHELRVTPTQIENSTGVKRATIYNIENGRTRRPDPDTLHRIATALALATASSEAETEAAIQVHYSTLMQAANYSIAEGRARVRVGWYPDEQVEMGQSRYTLDGVWVSEGDDGVVYTEIDRSEVERMMSDLTDAIMSTNDDDRTYILYVLMGLLDRFVTTPQRRAQLASGQRLSPYGSPPVPSATPHT